MKLKKKKKNKFLTLFRRFWAIFLGLVYLIVPFDFIPDILPVFGWGDDALVLIISFIVNYKGVLKRLGVENPKGLGKVFKAIIKGKSLREVMENLRENGINDSDDQIIEGEIISE